MGIIPITIPNKIGSIMFLLLRWATLSKSGLYKRCDVYHYLNRF